MTATTADHPDESGDGGTRRPWLARALWLVVTALALWLVVGGVTLLVAGFSAVEGRREITDVRRDLDAAALTEGDLAADLRDAHASFRRARDLARSPLTASWRVVPVAGRQIKSFSALADTAAMVSEVGADSVERVAELLDEPPSTGAARIALVEGIGETSEDALRRLEVVDLGPGAALVRPLADARDEVAADLEELRTILGTAADVSAGVGSMLRGPSRYLVLMANNAEMRFGSGMFLSTGVLDVVEGELALGEIEQTYDLYLPDEAAVDLDPDVEALWGWTEVRQEWRELGLSPRFDVTAAQAAAMWAAHGGGEVDGVLALDIVALQAILGATGPIKVDGTTYDESNVLGQLMYEQYVGEDGGNETDAARREVQGRLAEQAVAALQDGAWDAAVLLEGLADAAAGRHVMVWSPEEVQARAWRQAGVAGAIDGGSIMVGVVNRGGNKLDQFLHVEAALEVDGAADDDEVAITLTVDLRNDAPADGPPYVVGPHELSGLQAGEYGGALVVLVPGAHRDLEVSGAGITAAGPDGPGYVAVVEVRIPPGETERIVVDLIVPAGLELRWLPPARVPAVELHLQDYAE